MSDQKKQKVALSPGEFAAIFGKSQTWGYRQLYAGKVKAMTGYGRIMIPASEVDRVLSEAGRYLGQNRRVENSPDIPRPKSEDRTPKSVNPWKKAVESRKQTPGTLQQKKNSRRAAVRLNSKRSSAMRKLNKR
jgi:hypothetical protein